MVFPSSREQDFLSAVCPQYGLREASRKNGLPELRGTGTGGREIRNEKRGCLIEKQKTARSFDPAGMKKSR